MRPPPLTKKKLPIYRYTDKMKDGQIDEYNVGGLKGTLMQI